LSVQIPAPRDCNFPDLFPSLSTLGFSLNPHRIPGKSLETLSLAPSPSQPETALLNLFYELAPLVQPCLTQQRKPRLVGLDGGVPLGPQDWQLLLRESFPKTFRGAALRKSFSSSTRSSSLDFYPPLLSTVPLEAPVPAHPPTDSASGSRIYFSRHSARGSTPFYSPRPPQKRPIFNRLRGSIPTGSATAHHGAEIKTPLVAELSLKSNDKAL